MKALALILSKQHDVGLEGCRLFQAGFLAACREIAVFRDLRLLWKQTEDLYLAAGFDLQHLQPVNCDFLEEVAQTIRGALVTTVQA